MTYIEPFMYSPDTGETPNCFRTLMIKKLGDFTVRELLEFCEKRKTCSCCPFNSYCHKHGAMTRISKADLMLKAKLEEDKPQKCKDLRGLC